MAFTSAEEIRILAIEESLNELQVAITYHVAARKFVEQMLLLKQNEIDLLKSKVTILESEVTILQGQIS